MAAEKKRMRLGHCGKILPPVSSFLLREKREKNFFGGERGFVFLDIAISMPIMIMLLACLSGIFLWAARAFERQTADFELQQEIRIAMERIVEDAARAKSVTIDESEGFSRLTFLRAQENSAANGDKIVYMAHRLTADTVTLCRNDAQNPLTGASIAGGVTITAFRCENIAPNLVRIVLTGESAVTRHEFSLCSAVYVP